MKNLKLSVLGVACLVALASCSTTQNIAAITEANEEPIDFTQSPSCIVYHTDGTVATYHRLKLVTGVLKTPYLLADNAIKLEPETIHAYESNGVYALSQKSFATGARGRIATRVLPGFAVKEVSGPINLYSLQVSNNNYITKKYFLQKGDNGVVVPYTATVLKDWFGNNTSIANFVKNKQKKINEAELIAIIQHCNMQQDLTFN